jgi:hypothetical protein
MPPKSGKKPTKKTKSSPKKSSPKKVIRSGKQSFKIKIASPSREVKKEPASLAEIPAPEFQNQKQWKLPEKEVRQVETSIEEGELERFHQLLLAETRPYASLDVFALPV